MFAHYTGIEVGHDAMQLRRYAHGLVQVDDHLAADSKEEGGKASVEESPCGQLEASSQNDGIEGDEEDEGDEGDEDSASTVSEGSEEDSDFEARF